MVVDPEKTLKYRLVRGIRGRGSWGIRRGSCTKIAITHSSFNLKTKKVESVLKNKMSKKCKITELLLF